VRELVRAAQGMKRVIRDTPKLVVEQSQVIGAKKRDFEFLTSRPPLPKKEKSGQSSSQFQKRGGSSIPRGNVGGSKRVGGRGAWGGKSRQGVKTAGGSIEQRDQYIHFVIGVSSDTLEIALRCQGDVIFVEVRGIDGKSARM